MCSGTAVPQVGLTSQTLTSASRADLPSYLLLGTCTGILKKPKNGLFWGVLDGGGGSVRIKISARFARGGVQVHFILGVAVGSVRE